MSRLGRRARRLGHASPVRHSLTCARCTSSRVVASRHSSLPRPLRLPCRGPVAPCATRAYPPSALAGWSATPRPRGRGGRSSRCSCFDTPTTKAVGCLLQPGLPPSGVFCAVHKRFRCPCAPRPTPGYGCPSVSGVFMALLGSRSSRRHRTPVFYHPGATVDAPLVSTRRCADPIHPTTKAVGFLEGLCKPRARTYYRRVRSTDAPPHDRYRYSKKDYQEDSHV